MTAVDPKPKPLAQVAPSGSEWIMEWIHGIMHIHDMTSHADMRA